MKHFLRYSFVALMAMFVGNAFADEFKVTFKDCGGDSDDGTKQTEISGIVAEGGSIFSAVEATDIYQARTGRGIKLGTSKRAGSLILTLSPTIKISTIKFTARKYNDSELAITVNGKDFTELDGEFKEYTVELDGSEVDKISITTPEKRAYITTMTIIGEATGNSNPGGNNESTSPEDPLTVSSLQAMEALARGLETYNVESEPFYVKGKIAQISEVSAQYGNASFYIADEVTDTYQMYVFRSKYLEKANFTAEDQIKVGDEVIIYGTFVLYKKDDASEPVPEIKNCYIYSLNGKTKDEGGNDNPDPQVKTIKVAEALEIINALADGKTTSEEYIVKGIVSAVDEISVSYGNATFDIVDNANDQSALKVFRAKDAEGQKITNEEIVKVGDEVVVQGKLQKYVKNDVVTPEVAQNGKILTVNGQSTGIEIVKVQPTNVVLYNLAGQRVDANYKGVVIKNGQKMIQK